MKSISHQSFHSSLKTHLHQFIFYFNLVSKIVYKRIYLHFKVLNKQRIIANSSSIKTLLPKIDLKLVTVKL